MCIRDRAYADVEKNTLLGSAVAEANGKVTIDNLDFGADAGRVYLSLIHISNYNKWRDLPLIKEKCRYNVFYCGTR